MPPTILNSGQEQRIGVLTNPLSGTNRKGMKTLSETISKYPQAFHKNVQTPQDIYEALFDFASHGVDLIVISGGDGTVQAVLTVLFNHQPFAKQPQLVVLEAGTTNMIAGDVGILGDQNKALRRLFQWAHNGSGRVMKKQRPVIRLQVPGHEVKCGMFFGAASISQGIQYYQKNLHNKGLQGFPGICLTLGRYLWATIRKHSQSSTATRIEYGLNGQPLQKENFLLLFISTLDRLFFGLRPFWGLESGPLRYTAIRTGARFFPWILPFLAKGRWITKGTRENGYSSHNADEIELDISDSVALDGEIYTPQSGQKPTLIQCGGIVTFLRV